MYLPPSAYALNEPIWNSMSDKSMDLPGKFSRALKGHASTARNKDRPVHAY